MKRLFQLSALILCAVLTTFSLCSCNALDEAKANRAIYNEDKSVITFRDNEYRKMDIGKYEFIIDYDSSDVYYVTTPDVPVLLADSFGEQIYTNKEESVLKYSNNRSYVRSDCYDKVKKAVDGAKLDQYFFYVYHYDDDMQYGENIMLNEKEAEVIDKALKASEKEKLSYTELSNGAYDIETIRLSVCDIDMLLTDEYASYYIFRDREKYYFWDGNTYKDKTINLLNDEDTAVIRKLFEKYPDAIEVDNISWHFENNDYYVNSDEEVIVNGVDNSNMLDV